MNRTRAGILVGVLSALGVLVLAMAAADKKSPGRISSVHGRIAELDGGAACSACHGGWFGSMTSACITCHAEIGAQIEARRGLHGSLQPALATNCSTCHSEHHGDEFRLVNRLAFAQAGVPDPRRFDHRIVGFAMAGVHLTLDCRACHEHADAELLPEGARRFLGLTQDCSSCHMDPHGGRMQFGCVSCHSQQDFRERDVPEHGRWLPLTGVHGETGCRACHALGTVHALEALAPGANRAARQCADCHTAPHSQRFLAGNAAAAGRPLRAVCVDCHQLDHRGFGDQRATVTAEQHRHGGFPLVEPHAAVACASCHAPDAPWSVRHPGRTPRDCRVCHGDPHQGQFDTGPFAADGCVGCHSRTRFAPHEFDLDHHARAALPLDGRHATLECRACHPDPAPDAVRTFRGTPDRCESCHQDAHRGAFGHRIAGLAARPRGACAECHGTAAWGDLDHARFDHFAWTGFAIDGAHAQIECTDCHARTAEPDHFGRRFGRIPEHGGEIAGCQVCHGDPHDGVFDRPGMPAEVAGRASCKRCHDTASFRVLPFGFEHGAFTGFPLTGRHGELACSVCHPPLAGQDLAGRTVGKARGNECADCHADPHRRQFERLGSTNCARCHRSTESFGVLSFRHNLDSRFPIEDQHAKVPCAACHKPEKIDGVTAVRYRPLPMECIGCHGREEGGAPFRRRRQ